MADKSEKIWTSEWKHLLLTTRLQIEADFASRKKKNRVVLWEKVLREIKAIDETFPFSRDEIMRKYSNFMVTYKRIKERNGTSGESATTWEFFEKMDEVYGTRSHVTVTKSKYNMADKSEKKWTFEWKQLLLTTRLKIEADFASKKKKRIALWEKVLREIKAIDETFPFSRDEIMRKYLNFMVTYERIKKRNRTSGESATTWEFFEKMDEVYGTRSHVTVTKYKYNMADKSEKKWTFEWKQLLLTTRLQIEADFASKKKKRIVLWEKVLREIKAIDETFPFSREEIMRKYLNFMITYKRIKRRNGTSGQSATTWEFFEKMDEVYGTRSYVTVPESMLDSSLESILLDTSDSPITPNTSASPQEPPRKRMRCKIIEFLRNESDADKEILNEFLRVEKEKLSMEKQKIEEIKKLREAMCEILKRNYTCT